jgi:hypothetical protein
VFTATAPLPYASTPADAPLTGEGVMNIILSIAMSIAANSGTNLLNECLSISFASMSATIRLIAGRYSFSAISNLIAEEAAIPAPQRNVSLLFNDECRFKKVLTFINTLN